MLANGTNPYQQRPAPPTGMMYSQSPQQPMTAKQQWKMGQAQPVQQQSQGTPYGQYAAPQQPGRANSMVPYGAPGGANPFPISVSYAPGTPQNYREQSYGDVAGRMGYAPAPQGGYYDPRPQQLAAEQQRRVSQTNAEIDAIMGRYPGISRQQAMDARNQEAQARTQQGQESWIERYGSQSQKQEQQYRRQQQEQWNAERQKYLNPPRVAQNEQRPWKYDPSVPGGISYLDAPGRAQPIQPPSQGTPYGGQSYPQSPGGFGVQGRPDYGPGSAQFGFAGGGQTAPGAGYVGRRAQPADFTPLPQVRMTPQDMQEAQAEVEKFRARQEQMVWSQPLRRWIPRT